MIRLFEWSRGKIGALANALALAKYRRLLTAGASEEEVSLQYDHASMDMQDEGSLRRYLRQACWVSDVELDLVPHDNQVLAAAAMLRGLSVELGTGEGKTLVGAIVAVGAVRSGKRVHILTANDYLAERDAAWMRPYFSWFDVSVDHVDSSMTISERKAAYSADVVYVSVSEAAFDALRDRFARESLDCTQACREFVIIDELDAVLLDEARLPFVLGVPSARLDERANLAQTAAQVVQELREGTDYVLGEDRRSVHLSDIGFQVVENRYPELDLFGEHSDVLRALNLALHAHAVLRRDHDYVVQSGRVWLVSPTKGRLEVLQRWPEGLQTAVETKENLTATASLIPADQVVIADLVSMYSDVVGMSGTLSEVVDELESVFDVRVLTIPDHMPSRRCDHGTSLYVDSQARDLALVDLVRRSVDSSRPVLVATQSVEASERVAQMLLSNGVGAILLNARTSRSEAEVVSAAGHPGRVTVSTQMSGRGVDIELPQPSIDAGGGLFIVGVGRFPSRRLDRQLSGRAGRQGQPGDSVFLVSLDDESIERVGPLPRVPSSVDLDGLVHDRKLQKMVDHAQRVSEGEAQGLRLLTTRYGDLLGSHRVEVLRARAGYLGSEDSVPAGLDEVIAAASDSAGVLLRGSGRYGVAASQAVLDALDQLWLEHLSFAIELREGIHLRLLAREDPLVEFNTQIGQHFRETFGEFRRRAAQHLIAQMVDPGEAAMTREFRTPSAMWAFAIADTGLGTELERLARRLMRNWAQYLFPRRGSQYDPTCVGKGL